MAVSRVKKAPMLDRVIKDSGIKDSGERKVHRALEWYPWVIMEVQPNGHTIRAIQ